MKAIAKGSLAQIVISSLLAGPPEFQNRLKLVLIRGGFRFLNILGHKQKFRWEYHGTDYKEVVIAWGLYSYRSGTRIIVEIACTESAFKMLQHFQRDSVQIIKGLQNNAGR